MTDFIKSMQAASSGMAAQSARLRVTSENIANADTPGYQRKILPFEEVFDRDNGVVRVAPGRLFLDDAELERIQDPSHPLANSTGYYESSNVDLVIEIADAREAQRSYEANLKIFDQTRRMAASLLDLLKQ